MKYTLLGQEHNLDPICLIINRPLKRRIAGRGMNDFVDSLLIDVSRHLKEQTIPGSYENPGMTKKSLPWYQLYDVRLYNLDRMQRISDAKIILEGSEMVHPHVFHIFFHVPGAWSLLCCHNFESSRAFPEEPIRISFNMTLENTEMRGKRVSLFYDRNTFCSIDSAVIAVNLLGDGNGRMATVEASISNLHRFTRFFIRFSGNDAKNRIRFRSQLVRMGEPACQREGTFAADQLDLAESFSKENFREYMGYFVDTELVNLFYQCESFDKQSL